MSVTHAYNMLDMCSVHGYTGSVMSFQGNFHRRTPMTLVRWNPGRELASMEIDRLNRMFDHMFAPSRSWAPAVDIYETHEHEYVVKAELPEMKRDDIAVAFENNVLTLSGERKAEFDGDYHHSERFYGKFTRSFTLPA